MITLKEQYLYGSKRLGVRRPQLELARAVHNPNGYEEPVEPTPPAERFGNACLCTEPIPGGEEPYYPGVAFAARFYTHTLGMKEYEITNHLGNVLATVLDRKTGVKASATAITYAYFKADVTTAQDYYPFGSLMPGRTYVAPANAAYRFGFNGMQRDDELNGPGNALDFGARMYDSRLGRWMSVDRLASLQPESSSYKSMNNNPLIFIDPDGNTEYLVINIHNQQTGKTHTVVQVMDKDKVKERQNWWRQGSTSVYNYSYHAIYKTQNITIAKSGDVSVSKMEETYSKANYIRHPLLRFVPEIPEFSLSGNGGVQKGGIYLTSIEGGIDPTKFKSLSSVEHRDITSLLGSLSAIGKARSLRDN